MEKLLCKGAPPRACYGRQEGDPTSLRSSEANPTSLEKLNDEGAPPRACCEGHCVLFEGDHLKLNDDLQDDLFVLLAPPPGDTSAEAASSSLESLGMCLLEDVAVRAFILDPLGAPLDFLPRIPDPWCAGDTLSTAVLSFHWLWETAWHSWKLMSAKDQFLLMIAKNPMLVPSSHGWRSLLACAAVQAIFWASNSTFNSLEL